MTRDMTRKQFFAALERNGFGLPILGAWVQDRWIDRGPFYGMVIDRRGKILRRLTLAHLIKCREQGAKVRR